MFCVRTPPYAAILEAVGRLIETSRRPRRRVGPTTADAVYNRTMTGNRALNNSPWRFLNEPYAAVEGARSGSKACRQRLRRLSN
jgi:hypothetical protein